MADPIYKVVEVVGTSEQSISKAIDNAINKASGTLRNLGWFEVAHMRGAIARPSPGAPPHRRPAVCVPDWRRTVAAEIPRKPVAVG
jgi:flavin-binding protein dodecin